MFLSEHVLYGSSRLGTSTYNQKMGYASGSLAYPAGPGFNVCYTESDEVESDREPMGGQTTGPIGGGTMETIKPYGPHKVPGTRVPIVGVNLPWAGDDHDIKPTKQPTTFVPGRKRYEFSNHLGNVLVTVSDKPLGVDGNSDGIAEYYMPDVKTTSDYEPFGAPLAERTESETTDYRFGMQGREKEDDLYGEGNAYDFGSRIYNPLIGKWLSRDPLQRMYASLSPYQGFANNPILMVDPTGCVIINGHSDENPDEKKKVDDGISLLQAHNIELYTFLQTARVTPDGEILYKTPDGQIVYHNNNGSTAAENGVDVNALYEQSMDIKVTVVITDIDGKSGDIEKRDYVSKLSEQGSNTNFAPTTAEKHLNGTAEGNNEGLEASGFMSEKVNGQTMHFTYTDESASDASKTYLTDDNINTIRSPHFRVLRVNQNGDLNYNFTVKLDDFIRKNDAKNFMYGYTLAHEGGHIWSILTNAVQAYYFSVLKGNKDKGHEPNNPSGKAAESAEDKFKNSYYGGK